MFFSILSNFLWYNQHKGLNLPDTQIKLFDNQDIRTLWDEKQEKWYFSIVDIIAALTESVDATAYWRKLKQRLKAEGNETVTNCHALKMVAKDGKSRLTDVADTEQILRIIQSIPSKKAEPFKLWLASVGAQRIDEVADPEIAKKEKPTGLKANMTVANRGGKVARQARLQLEQETGKSVITGKNSKLLKKI